MSDPAELVERLRAGKRLLTAGGPVHYPETDALRLEAASLIIAQQKRVEALEVELRAADDALMAGIDCANEYEPHYTTKGRDALKVGLRRLRAALG